LGLYSLIDAIFTLIDKPKIKDTAILQNH